MRGVTFGERETAVDAEGRIQNLLIGIARVYEGRGDGRHGVGPDLDAKTRTCDTSPAPPCFTPAMVLAREAGSYARSGRRQNVAVAGQRRTRCLVYLHEGWDKSQLL